MLDIVPANYAAKVAERLSQLLSQGGMDGLMEAARSLREQLQGKPQPGMYEVLEYEAVLDLKDRHGQTAILERRQKVRFLQDGIIAYEDRVWGEGDIFAEYQCSPGVTADRYKDGPRWKVLISLRDAKRRGEVTEFRFRRKITEGFTGSEEWLQTEVSHKTDWLLIRIIFPGERPCQRAQLVERKANKTTDLELSCFGLLPDGRQALTWETRRPDVDQLYTIRWWW